MSQQNNQQSNQQPNQQPQGKQININDLNVNIPMNTFIDLLANGNEDAIRIFSIRTQITLEALGNALESAQKRITDLERIVHTLKQPNQHQTSNEHPYKG